MCMRLYEKYKLVHKARECQLLQFLTISCSYNIIYLGVMSSSIIPSTVKYMQPYACSAEKHIHLNDKCMFS